jgi:hypothetical protein
MSLGEFYIDVFLGLWFGRDYTPAKYDENPPPTSVAVLYHFLHATIPPPNIVYLGVFSGGFAPTAAGLYVNGVTDI